MFVGAIPKETVEQAVRVIGIDRWREVHVCCSGSFRIERALGERFPGLKLHSNDVSLLTCSIGRLAAGQPLRIEFVERLAFVEDLLKGAEARDRVAAVLVALEMGKYTSANAWAKRHFEHYVQNFRVYHDKARAELVDYLDGLRIESFFCGDFREHARKAIERGAAIIAWPPTYKGGYERQYKFLSANTRWDEPTYDVFDPKDLPDWVTSLRVAGAQFWVGSDHTLEGLEPAFALFTERNRPVYAYATADDTSIRSRGHKSLPFKYSPVEPDKLTKDTPVRLVQPNAGQMNFIKDKYLKTGLAHVTGTQNFLVYLGDQLAGGFIYARSRMGEVDEIYLLSDFALSRERRLSKLIAMLATSEAPVRAFDRAYVQRTKQLSTTAFTDKPVSMKYRGIFEVHSRKPGFIQYVSKVRPGTPDEVYREWFRKHAGA